MSETRKRSKYKFVIAYPGVVFPPIYRDRIETGVNYMAKTIQNWQKTVRKTARIIVYERSTVSDKYVSIHTVEVPPGFEPKNLVDELMKGSLKVTHDPEQLELFPEKADLIRDEHTAKFLILKNAGYNHDPYNNSWSARFTESIPDSVIKQTPSTVLEFWISNMRGLLEG